ncbi:hypothetical protein QFZ62_001468 [Clavibacter sp. B3I6]|uniref:hypothetical protein n=1 Tax=Clavibacter sp. B3I6 TaxID=3042268 RepID=UPI0027840280|nr:hypothetical protein [Clavibacter sp. B3I6]MDQ0744160.1 hypothetical protein [Clavibacter sp. B3I6]
MDPVNPFRSPPPKSPVHLIVFGSVMAAIGLVIAIAAGPDAVSTRGVLGDLEVPVWGMGAGAVASGLGLAGLGVAHRARAKREGRDSDR